MLLKILGVAFVGIICALFVKQIKPEFSVLISLATGILIIILIADGINSVLNDFTIISETAGVDSTMINTIIKIIGIGYLTEFTADTAEESGNKSIANKIIFAGKIIIAIVAMPMIKNLFELIVDIL